MEQQSQNPHRVLDCIVELTALSRLPRTGWILAGVQNAESIADHCFETAIIAYILSKTLEVEVDIGKVFAMALFHEVGEVRLADLPRRSKPYVKEFKNPAEAKATADVLDGVAEDLIPLLTEMHHCKSPEARLVEAAEELQIILRAMLYAKEQNGDMAEYRIDVDKYDSLGVTMAQKLAEIIKERLLGYLGDKKYWPIGYHLKKANP